MEERQVEYIWPSKENFPEKEQNMGLKNFMLPESSDYEKIKEYALKNYTFDGFNDKKGYILKPIEDIIYKNMKEYNGVYYQFEKTNCWDGDLTDKLVVWFPPLSDKFTVNAEMRYFAWPNQRWSSLMKRVPHNTSILRIADTNLITGSFFQNTVNFPDYEDNVQNLIKKIAKENHIEKENIFLVGESRGAVGAFLHGLLGDYPMVLLDPLLDRSIFWEEFKDNCDTTFSFDLVPTSFLERYNHLLASTLLTPNKIKLITSDNVTGSYTFLKKLHLEKITLLNLNYKMLFNRNAFYSHGTFAWNNYNILLRYLNEFLIDVDITLEKDELQFDWENWSVRLPDTSRTFYFKILDDSLKVVRTSYNVEDNKENKLNFSIKTSFKKNSKYKISFELKRNEKSFFLGKLYLCTENKEQLINRNKIEQKEETYFAYYTFISDDSYRFISLFSEDYVKDWEVDIININIQLL